MSLVEDESVAGDTEVQALLAEREDDDIPEEEETLEESEALDVLATWSRNPVAWKEVRTAINATKLS